MSVLIIAEKPSLGRNIASALGIREKKEGYLEGKGYIVTWALGHLFSLCDVDSYLPENQRGGKWTLDNLPCFPEKFKFELKRSANKDSDGKRSTDSGVKKQFSVIKSLCQRKDVDTIVNAGDSDREGEIIVRLCVSNALSKSALSEKKFMRLWLPDQTPETIREAIKEMKPETEYDCLANEGYARTFVDWLYGINLTRYATLKSGMFLRVGRVVVPIVEAIYERDFEIRNFVPQKYFAVVSKTEREDGVLELVSKNKFDKDKLADAESYCSRLNVGPAKVLSIEEKRQVVSPGKLYSLSKLQGVLGRKYGMSMKESLDIVQGLYEKGYLSYPRTNSEYLSTNETEKVGKILENCRELGYKVKLHTSKSVFDDSKIESHSALTPTGKLPEKDELTASENRVYSTVFNRFIAVFAEEECVAIKTAVRIASVGNIEEFVIRGSRIIEKGWTEYDEYTSKDKMLPKLCEGESIGVDFKPTEKETQPPKHYTTETLNNYLKNPFREEKSNTVGDDEEYKAILEGVELGTEATRTGIIENAKKSEYISQSKDVYTILPAGESLVAATRALGINMDKHKTSQVGVALKKVYRGSLTVDECVKMAEDEISKIFDANASYAKPSISAQAPIGACPKCGGQIIKGKYGYYCAEKCGMNIAKVFGKELTETQLKSLLDGKEISYTSNGKKTVVVPEVASNEYNGKTYYQWKTKKKSG